jgi:hypothetical protein
VGKSSASRKNKSCAKHGSWKNLKTRRQRRGIGIRDERYKRKENPDSKLKDYEQSQTLIEIMAAADKIFERQNENEQRAEKLKVDLDLEKPKKG